MLDCFTSPTTTAVPIIPVIEKDFNTWLSAQDKRLRNYVGSIGFRAKSASWCNIVDQHGKLERVLIGMSNPQDWTVFGQLAATLPKGIYQFPTDKQLSYTAYLAWGLGSYQFTVYKKAPRLEAQLVLPETGVDKAYLQAILRATYLVRDLVNTPAEDMMPLDLNNAATQVAQEFGASIDALVGDDLLKNGYAAIHSVGRASEHPPQLIDLRWGDKAHPKITLVGKGVCFDTGGLDLKNAANMATMKKDMGGAAHVLGVALAIMSLKLPIQLRVLIPAVDNAVSGNAYRPGDVLVTRKGISVEVTNTDAEGRLVLCEALDEAAKENPELLIDFATLTGASRVAVGTEIAALFTPNKPLAEQLTACSEEENDPIWRLPIYAPYRKLMDSRIADIVNSAMSPYGGAITAALFLKEFVPDHITWAHFDIMAYNVSSKPAAPEGGEANALRAVVRYLCQNYPSPQ